MVEEIIYNVDYDDDKDNLLLLYPKFSPKSDTYKIIRAYSNLLRKDYNVITLYSDDAFSDAFYDIDEKILYDENSLYNASGYLDFKVKIDKVVVCGLLFDINVNLSLMFENIICQIPNAKHTYAPILLNYKNEENDLDLRLEFLTPNITFHGFDKSFSAFYSYTYNLFTRYGIKTMSKPYICLCSDDIEKDHYLDAYIKKSDYFAKTSCN